jgi:hypothetical protein
VKLPPGTRIVAEETSRNEMGPERDGLVVDDEESIANGGLRNKAGYRVIRRQMDATAVSNTASTGGN